MPTIEFSTPIGASALQAQAGNVTVSGGVITAVEVADPGDGYTSPATVTVTQGFGGSGANLSAVMQVSGTRDVVSVFRTCSIRVFRRYNRPYQNLYIRAMPPPADRSLIDQLLDNQSIIVPEYLYRPADPNFGKSRQVTYYHAFGLAPDSLDRYVASLYENHYYKNLTLGEIQTAQAIDPVTGEVVYEVVYSKIIDNLVNDAGQSVSKIVNLAYPIIDPITQAPITQVYPNSLVNMRNQVIDVVGQISIELPLWMTSKQSNGRVLGFTPAWVICYTKPERSNQIAYYIGRFYGEQLNRVDFGVDRYILDRTLSRNWDTDTQRWTPAANLTTFDRFNTGGNVFVGTVDIATNLAFADVNNRTLEYINNLGGLDGFIFNVDNNTIIFAKQEQYDGPPGSNYPTTTDAWQNYDVPFDSGETNGSEGSFDAAEFDQAFTVPGGNAITCVSTDSVTDRITSFLSLGDIRPGQPIKFTSGVIGGIVQNQQYYVLSVDSSFTFRITDTQNGTTPVALTTDSGIMTAEPANERMAIYRISIDSTGLISLTLIQQTYENQYVTINRGNTYRSATLYYPGSPGPGLSRVSWLPLLTVVTAETTFDQRSMAFVEPVDMYDPTDTIDKYLVFPKQNILV